MRVFFILFLVFIRKNVVAQQLHHEMISSQCGSKISAYVFNVLGRLVYSEEVRNEDNSIKLNLLQLSSA